MPWLAGFLSQEPYFSGSPPLKFLLPPAFGTATLFLEP